MVERRLSNRSRYNAISAAYEVLVRFGSFGQFGRFYRAVARELDESPGATILDLGCGPGTLVPFLLEKVGPSGRIVGVESDGGDVVVLEEGRKKHRVPVASIKRGRLDVEF